MDQLAGVRIKVLPEQPGLFKRPVNLEQYRHLKVVEMLTGKRLPYDQYGVVVIDTAQKPAPPCRVRPIPCMPPPSRHDYQTRNNQASPEQAGSQDQGLR